MSDNEYHEELGKIVGAQIGTIDNGYKNALHFWLTVEYEGCGVQGFGRDYITTRPIRAFLDMFGARTVSELNGKVVRVLRKTDKHGEMIVGFKPVRFGKLNADRFLASDWVPLEEKAYELLKDALEKDDRR